MNLRRNFLTGLLVIVPAVVAGWVLYQAFIWVDHLLWDRVRFSFLRKGGVPGVGVLIVLLIVLVVGTITNDYIGGRIVRRWERLLLRIPLFNKIYGATKQVSEAFLSPDRTTVFRSVGLVEYPRKGTYILAFEVSTAAPRISKSLAAVPDQELVAVFVPSTPNPTTGFLLFVPRVEYHVVPVTLEDGFKMVISGGVFMPGDTASVEAAAKELAEEADRIVRGA